MHNWAPGETTEVDLIDVQNQVHAQTKIFKAESIWYDPHQAKLMAQQLSRKRIPMREMSFGSPKNLTAMALAFQQVVENGTLECYDVMDGTLRRDFGKFDMVERASGLKLDASMADEFGHADVGTALVICLPRALEMLGGVQGALQPEDEMGWDPDKIELSKKEVEDMPDHLRAIYEMKPLGRDKEERHWIGEDG